MNAPLTLAVVLAAVLAGAPPLARQAEAAEAAPMMPMMMVPSELKWGPVASMKGDARMAVIEGELGKAQPFTFRLHLPADYQLAPHTHPALERVTVLSGTLHFAHGRDFDRGKTRALPTGSVAIMPAGEPMFGYTEGEVMLQLHGTGPWGIEYLDPADDPRRAKD